LEKRIIFSLPNSPLQGSRGFFKEGALNNLEVYFKNGVRILNEGWPIGYQKVPKKIFGIF